MTTTPAIGTSWLLMLLISGVGALPSAGAPLPLDPALSAVAPEECLWYAASAGIGPAESGSDNQTEQLFAEPQVQRFLAEVETHVMAAIRRAGGPAREQRVALTEGPKIVKALLTRPLAMYVADVQKVDDHSVSAEAAFVLNAGDQREELAAAIGELVKLGVAKGLKLTPDASGVVEWQRVELPPNAPPVRFGWKDAYLIIAVGDATANKIADRMTGDAPEWLTKLRAEHPIEREMSLGYVNVAGILERVKPLVEAENPQAWPIVERLGLTNIQALHAVAGYDAKGCTTMGHIVTDGQRPGLLAFLPYQPLTADDLAMIPQDALVATAVRLNPTELLEKGLELVSQFEPRAKEDFDSHMWEVESQIGVNMREDVVGSVGDAWVAYLPSGDLMLSWLNSAIAVQVKDASTLRAAFGKLLDVAKAEMARNQARVSIAETTAGGQTIYSLQFQGEPVPFSPSLCITDKWLVVGLLPQAVQAAIDRKAEASLAVVPSIAATLEAEAGPAALFYQDTPQLVRSAYPFVQMAVQMISGPLRQEGITIDTTALPAVDTIVKHLRPTISTWAHEDNGFHATSRGSMPGGGNAVVAAPVVAAVLLPAISSARSAAQQSQEMNHLKMIGLAFHNYVAAKGTFPTDVYSEDGKPLLSWRVKLLPYMETGGMELYKQIKLDEPWDSEHNRQFHDQMPLPYRSMTSEELTNRTRFLALKGAETLFPGNENINFRHVTDGTSNTILFVQASPDAAVEWMKPGDLDFDPEHPFAGVAQPSGQFLAAFCDGSVRPISLAVGGDTMKALATRAGGEVIEYDALTVPPAPHLYEVEAAGELQEAAP